MEAVSVPKKMEIVSATECANCGTTTTPLWRRGPNGETICNACGLYLKARNTLRPPTLKRSNKKENDCGGGGTCPGGGQCNGTGGSTACAGCPAFNQHQVNRQALICANCRTTTTPLWRRDEAGNTICNACGLYYKLHHVHRPVSMKRSVIKRRKRIILAQGSDEEDTESVLSSSSRQTTKKHSPEIPEIEDYVHKKRSFETHTSPPAVSSPESLPTSDTSHSLQKTPSLLPPISSERQSYKLQSLFAPRDSPLPSLALPPLNNTPVSLSPSPPHRPPSSHSTASSLFSHLRTYELADFDTALDRLEHLRRQVRPEQAYALSQLTQSLTELATQAEVVLSLDSLAYGS
ncbi:hypothetical protein BY458DRAFT_499925 [Sporodiniella umbellata]|nr:hypothetical protein BY458DRAFT_499925 [Sporodiniella umbellata]